MGRYVTLAKTSNKKQCMDLKRQWRLLQQPMLQYSCYDSLPSTGRPVCLSGHVRVVLVPDQGDPWDGCAGTKLAPGPCTTWGKYMVKHWLYVKIITSCKCVGSRPVRSSTDVCQQGTVCQCLGGGNNPGRVRVLYVKTMASTIQWANLCSRDSPSLLLASMIDKELIWGPKDLRSGDPRHGCTGIHRPWDHAFPSVRLPWMQGQGLWGAGLASWAIPAQPDLVPGTNAPQDNHSLVGSPEEGPSLAWPPD